MANAGGQSTQRRIQLVLIVLLLVVAAYGAYRQSRVHRPQPQRPADGDAANSRPAQTAEGTAEGQRDDRQSERQPTGSAPTIVRGQTIRDLDGDVAYQGDIDLSATLARIKVGELLRFANDGATFQNRERRLPRKPPGYYKEYVHPTPGLSGPGPQRIVIGQNGETYYTPDHYATFQRVDK